MPPMSLATDVPYFVFYVARQAPQLYMCDSATASRRTQYATRGPCFIFHVARQAL